MPNVDHQTNWPGVVVRIRPTDSKAFLGMAQAALAKIDSKPVGQALLQAIVAEVGKLKFGFTVCVMAIASEKKSFGPLIRWRKYQKGSVTRASNETNAENGVGSVSVINWDPASKETPDGARPTFVALAHELVHCMHNLKGTAHLTGMGHTRRDEMMVVGLSGYEMFPITENRIRREHGIPYRMKYDGVCDLGDAPDTATLDQAPF